MAKQVKTLRKSLGEQETENKRLEKVISDLEGRALKSESLLETKVSQEKQSTANTPAQSSNIRKREKLSRVKSPSRVRKQKAYGLQRGARSDEQVAELFNNHMSTMNERVQRGTSQELLWNGPAFLQIREPWTFNEEEEEQSESNAFADRLEEEEMARPSPEVLVVQVSNVRDEPLPHPIARAESKEEMSEKADTLLVSKSSETNNINETNMDPLADGLRDLSLNGSNAGGNGGVILSNASVTRRTELVGSAQATANTQIPVCTSQQEISQTRGAKGQTDAMHMDTEQTQTAVPSPEHEDVQHVGQGEQIDMTPVETMPNFGDSQGVEGLEIQHIDTGSQQLSPQLFQPESSSRRFGTETGTSQMLESTSVPLVEMEEAEEMSGQELSTANCHINEDKDRACIQQAETSGSPSIDGGSAMEVSPMATGHVDKGKGRADPEHPEATLRKTWAFRNSKLKRKLAKYDPDAAGSSHAPKKACNSGTLTASARAQNVGQPLPELANDLTRVPQYARYTKNSSPLDNLTWEEAVVMIESLFSRGAPLWKAAERWRMTAKIDFGKMFRLFMLCKQTMHVIDTIPREKEDLFLPCQFPRRLKWMKDFLADFPTDFPQKQGLIVAMDRLLADAERLNMAGK